MIEDLRGGRKTITFGEQQEIERVKIGMALDKSKRELKAGIDELPWWLRWFFYSHYSDLLDDR